MELSFVVKETDEKYKLIFYNIKGGDFVTNNNKMVL